MTEATYGEKGVYLDLWLQKVRVHELEQTQGSSSGKLKAYILNHKQGREGTGNGRKL